jgi:hypothetical protein
MGTFSDSRFLSLVSGHLLLVRAMIRSAIAMATAIATPAQMKSSMSVQQHAPCLGAE